ncbi:MAG: methylated-DNA--[protein]-cysteine S-methyltransferase [Planctomycetota bacterium]
MIWSGDADDLRMHGVSLDAAPDRSDRAPPLLSRLVADLIAGRDRTDALDRCAWDACTPFARQVLQTLARTVPCGCTTSYGELARRTGHPRAARAVGRVMAANPFPLVVPCHRCLTTDGRIGGFQGSRATIGLKRAMLLHEERVAELMH